MLPVATSRLSSFGGGAARSRGRRTHKPHAGTCVHLHHTVVAGCVPPTAVHIHVFNAVPPTLLLTTDDLLLTPETNGLPAAAPMTHDGHLLSCPLLLHLPPALSARSSPARSKINCTSCWEPADWHHLPVCCHRRTPAILPSRSTPEFQNSNLVCGTVRFTLLRMIPRQHPPLYLPSPPGDSSPSACTKCSTSASCRALSPSPAHCRALLATHPHQLPVYLHRCHRPQPHREDHRQLV